MRTEGRNSTGATTSQKFIRVLFVLLLLAIPTELAIKKLAHGEPYPALFLPSFGPVLEKDGVVTFREPEIIGISADGSRQVLDSTKVMPGAGGGYSVVFESIFTNQSKVDAQGAKDWLRNQLRESYPDSSFTSVEFVWMKTSYNSSTGQLDQSEDTSYSVDLGGPS